MSHNVANEAKTFEIITSFLLVLLCGKLAFSVILNEVSDKKINEARRETQILATQIAMYSINSFVLGTSRFIASEPSSAVSKNNIKLKDQGGIGNDPWGRPYQYKTVYSAQNQRKYFVVLSGGPNSKIETDLSQLDINQVSDGKVDTGGDDLAYIKSDNTKNNL